MFVMLDNTVRKQANLFFFSGKVSSFCKKLSVQQPLRCYWKDPLTCNTTVRRPQAA